MSVHTLANGTSISIRAVCPDDIACIQRGFQALSPETIYKRFFAAKSSLTEEELRYLTSCDGIDHVGHIVYRLDDEGHEAEGVAVGRWIRDTDSPDIAHAAFVVVDAWQRQGIGVLLARELAESALASGVRFWRAEAWAENSAGRTLLEKIGKVESCQISGGVADILVRLSLPM